MEKYRKFKADIGNQTKAMVKQIEKEQREEIFEQRRKKEEKKASTSGTQGAHAM